MIPNMFTSWELSVEEEIQGSILTTLQTQVLQNIQAMKAEEKNLLAYNPADSENFLQNEAALAGQIRLIQEVLDNSEAVQANQEEEIRREIESELADPQSQSSIDLSGIFSDKPISPIDFELKSE